MNKSETIGKLAEALAKAQKEMKGAVKDSSNPFYKSSYANLESVVDACKEALSKNGLSYSQTFDFHDGVDFLETVLMHSSGEWISGKQRMLSKDMTAQGMGSAASYNRRYGLAAICGVVQTDDDGNEASGRPVQQSRPAPQGMAQGFRK